MTISSTRRRAGGTGVGVEWRARSPIPWKNSTTMSQMSRQYAANTAISVPRWSSTSKNSGMAPALSIFSKFRAIAR